MFHDSRHPLLINPHMTRSVAVHPWSATAAPLPNTPSSEVYITPSPTSSSNSHYIALPPVRGSTMSTHQDGINLSRHRYYPPCHRYYKQTTTTLAAYIVAIYPFPRGFIHSFLVPFLENFKGSPREAVPRISAKWVPPKGSRDSLEFPGSTVGDWEAVSVLASNMVVQCK